MADESDYTQMWAGVFTPPPNDEGVYILDDERSVGRNTKIYDKCTRVLYEDAHPRTYPGGQRYPGPYGGGRASDRIGPTFDERRESIRRREKFSGSSRDKYIQGSRRQGHPGFRGMVTSGRDARGAVDNVTWDNRPPHYAPDTPAYYAHLSIDPKARGEPLFRAAAGYPNFPQVDKFRASGASGQCPHKCGFAPLEIAKFVLLFVLVILLATWLVVSGAEKRIRLEIEAAIRAAIKSA